MNTSQKNGARQYKKSEHPRLRWTAELHEQFAEAVDRLGGKHILIICVYYDVDHSQKRRLSEFYRRWSMYRSMDSPRNFNVIIPMKEPLQAERILQYDMGISSSFSSQRLLQGECLIQLECQRSDSKCDHRFSDESNGILQAKEGGGDPEQQDSGTSFAVSKSREENIDRLPAETCELSLSFTPSNGVLHHRRKRAVAIN
uniref:Uncharacterized protein n=1 Tax=Salix viminalis TaxID=40686 RepID=A0A6N2KWS2_SALVM